MKISIVTAVYNAAKTIQDTIDSVAYQSYSDKEHVVVDGASGDGTVEILNSNSSRLARFVSEPDKGVYDAMNKGLALATGDVVAFLNADDVYINPGVLERVAAIMANPDVIGCYANLYFVACDDTSRVVRRMTSQDYREGLFERGWMPPHPTLFVRRSLLNEIHGFDLDFSLQSDFDLAIRLFQKEGRRMKYVDETWVRMRMGGLSNRSWRHVLKGNWEAYQACRKNGICVGPWFPVVKVASRVPEFLRAMRASN